MKRLIALTAALILLCGSALAGYKGDSLEIYLFEELLKISGYKEFSGPVEIDGGLLYALRGLWIYFTLENGKPTACVIKADADFFADGLLIAYDAAIAFTNKRCDIMDIYREYKQFGKATVSIGGGWHCSVSDGEDGKLYCIVSR